MYSPDNGATWHYVQDGASRLRAFCRPQVDHRVTDGDPATSASRWPVPALQFPQGVYLLRVEAYRSDSELHYAYHQVRIFIQR